MTALDSTRRVTADRGSARRAGAPAVAMTLAELAARSDSDGTSVRLALNEPWWAPPQSVLAAARAAAENLHRYPTGGDDRRLVERIAEHHGVVPDQVVVGAGAAGLLRDVLVALCLQQHRRRAVVFAAPGFDLFGMLPGQLDSDAVAVPLTADGEQDLDGMARACTERTAVVVVCNPHNPTGAPVRRSALRAFLARVPAHVTVLLDEAYSAYVTDPAVPIGPRPIDGGPDRAPVAVLRSFSKSHALGGARVGYLLAAAGLAAAVRSRVLPFSVSRLGQVAALAALEAESAGAYAGLWAQVTAARADLRAALLKAGYPVPASHANFLWLPLREWSAHFGAHCAEHGVIVRAYSSYGVRVSIGSPADNESFLAAAHRYRGPRQPT